MNNKKNMFMATYCNFRDCVERLENMALDGPGIDSLTESEKRFEESLYDLSYTLVKCHEYLVDDNIEQGDDNELSKLRT